jgi:serine/threonine protein kinase
LIAGGNLAAAIGREPQPARSAARVVEALARAVEHAHKNGLIHRDRKPSNVLLDHVTELPTGSAPRSAIDDPNLVVKIADFGLAKRLEGTRDLTETGAILGRPCYMAPKQVIPDQPVGPGADIYALGAILYELLTGRPPFQGMSSVEVLIQVRAVDSVPPVCYQLPGDLGPDARIGFARARLLVTDGEHRVTSFDLTTRKVLETIDVQLDRNNYPPGPRQYLPPREKVTVDPRNRSSPRSARFPHGSNDR